jgi:hypothetical protein
MKSPRNANRLTPQLFQEVGSLTQTPPSHSYPLHRLPRKSGVVSINLHLLPLQIFWNFSQRLVDILCCLVGCVSGHGDSHHNSVRANVAVRRIHIPGISPQVPKRLIAFEANCFGSLQSWYASAPSAVEAIIIAPFHLNLAHLWDCVSKVDLQRLDGCFLGYMSGNLFVALLSKKRIWQGVDFLPQQFDLMAQDMIEIDLIAPKKRGTPRTAIWRAFQLCQESVNT